ncbi:hypothetical protein ACFQY7_13190 [Actinomadura luteofluorescens]|uniref:hypothetical protein n=1 Tax=Actinomadura luteofluorescens TaxID=46163 RepID=UPI00363934C1
MAVARACSAIGGGSGEPVGEPVHPAATWISSYRVDPFEVPEEERIALMAGWSRSCSPRRRSTTCWPSSRSSRRTSSTPISRAR